MGPAHQYAPSRLLDQQYDRVAVLTKRNVLTFAINAHGGPKAAKTVFVFKRKFQAVQLPCAVSN
jgi:hypothetical protein